MYVKDNETGLGLPLNIRNFSEPTSSQLEGGYNSYASNILSTLSYDYTKDFDNILQYENDSIKIWRAMAKNPYVKFAVDDVINEMISLESNEIYPIKLDMTNAKFSKSISKKINEEFDVILRLLEFTKKSNTLLTDWYVDGRAIFFINYTNEKNGGITEIVPLDPLKIKKQLKEKTDAEKLANKPDEYTYTYIDNTKNNMMSVVEFTEDNIIEINSGIMDDLHKIWVSPLYYAYTALNQVTSIEDAVVIYRLSRAPERRVFYVDTGELPKTKAETYMKDLIRSFKQNVEYDSETGQLKEKNRHSSILDDIWLPRRDGGKGTEVSTLQGGTNLSNIEDLEYFLKKLFRSLKVPFSRFTDTENAANVIGRTTEITRDELKYSKFIFSLRIQYNFLFYALLKKQCAIKNIISIEEFNEEFENIQIIWNSDTMFSELKNMDIIKERIAVLNEIEAYRGNYFSKEYISHEILRFTDDEWADMTKQMEKEAADPTIEPPNPDNDDGYNQFAQDDDPLTVTPNPAGPTAVPQDGPKEKPEDYEEDNEFFELKKIINNKKGK